MRGYPTLSWTHTCSTTEAVPEPVTPGNDSKCSCQDADSQKPFMTQLKTMQKSKDEIRKEKNRLSANLSYQKKKKQREDLENQNRRLNSVQVGLHRDMRKLQRLARCYESVLSQIVHTDTCLSSRSTQIVHTDTCLSSRSTQIVPTDTCLSSRSTGQLFGPSRHRATSTKDKIPNPEPLSRSLGISSNNLPVFLDVQNTIREEPGEDPDEEPGASLRRVPASAHSCRLSVSSNPRNTHPDGHILTWQGSSDDCAIGQDSRAPRPHGRDSLKAAASSDLSFPLVLSGLTLTPPQRSPFPSDFPDLSIFDDGFSSFLTSCEHARSEVKRGSKASGGLESVT